MVCEGSHLFFSRYILLQKTAYISASRQDIKNLVGKFEAIHANFQAFRFTVMAWKWGDRWADRQAIFGANRNEGEP